MIKIRAVPASEIEHWRPVLK